MENLHNPSRRLVVGGGALALMVAGSGLAGIRRAAAQEATPAPLDFELAPGVSVEIVELPTGDPSLFRAQVTGGTTWQASDGTDPSLSMVYSETGSLACTVDAAVTVFRGNMAGKPGDAIAASTEFEIGPGDYLVAPGLTAAIIRNDGSDPATMLIAVLSPPTT